MIISAGMMLPAMAAEITFGYGLDGSPVSAPVRIRNNDAARVKGFCGELVNYLSEENHDLNLQGLEVHERFGSFARSLEGRVGVQCGPDSKTRERAKMLAGSEGFSGKFSTSFAVTSTKLLIRNSKRTSLYTDTDSLRIGVLIAPDGSFPVTTSLISRVFPNSTIIRLNNRMEAVQHLTLPVDSAEAIDAYASDEIILADILRTDLPTWSPETWQNYSVAPSLYGFSREEYAVVVYNSPQLLQQINTWIESSAGRDAAAYLQVETDSFTASLRWLIQDNNLALFRMLISVLALLGSLLLVWLLWRYRRSSQVRILLKRSSVQETPLTKRPAVETVNSSTSEELLAEISSVPEYELMPSLTPRETEVLALLVQGHANKDIARELGGISPRTIETHRKNIYTKLGASTPFELVEYAQKYGLVKH